jgi:hypothetical protein
MGGGRSVGIARWPTKGSRVCLFDAYGSAGTGPQLIAYSRVSLGEEVLICS